MTEGCGKNGAFCWFLGAEWIRAGIDSIILMVGEVYHQKIPIQKPSKKAQTFSHFIK